MELRQLRFFQSVARVGSVAAAAGQLHLTASALSHALKALETELGFRLFDRVGKGLRLNAAGEQFLAGIEPHLAGLSAAAQSLRQLTKGGYSRLRVTAPASVGKHILPAVVRELQKTFPRVKLRIETADTLTMLEWIKAGNVDLGVGVKADGAEGVRSHSIFRDELLLMFAPSHAWVQV